MKRFSTVERWDGCSQFTKVAPLPNPLCNQGMVGLGGKLYCAGGHTGKQVARDVRVYNPTSNSWKNLAAMEYARQHFKLVAPADGNSMYAIGGKNAKHENVPTV